MIEELGRDVVVVAHSYSGSPATEAMKGFSKKDREAQRLAGGVVRLIYIAAGVPIEGENFRNALGVGHPPNDLEIHEVGNISLFF